MKKLSLLALISLTLAPVTTTKCEEKNKAAEIAIMGCLLIGASYIGYRYCQKTTPPSNSEGQTLLCPEGFVWQAPFHTTITQPSNNASLKQSIAQVQQDQELVSSASKNVRQVANEVLVSSPKKTFLETFLKQVKKTTSHDLLENYID